MEIEIKIQAIA